MEEINNTQRFSMNQLVLICLQTTTTGFRHHSNREVVVSDLLVTIIDIAFHSIHLENVCEKVPSKTYLWSLSRVVFESDVISRN